MNFIEGDRDGYDLFQVCGCKLPSGKSLCHVFGVQDARSTSEADMILGVVKFM